MAKVKKRKVVPSAVEPVLIGTPTEIEITRAFNHYNVEFEVGTAKKWLLEYLRRNKRPASLINAIKSAPDWRTQTINGWMARMMANGTVFTDAYMERFEARLQENASYGVKAKKETPAKVSTVSIQDRIKKNIGRLIEEIEELIDAGDEINLYEFLKVKEASAQAANAIRAFYIAAHDEVFSGDDQVKEAYGKTLKTWQKIYKSMIDDLDRYTNNKKVTKVRKPRTKKTKSAIDLIKNLKYQKEEPTLKLMSVNPAEIVGCSQLWTYNTKTKKLTKFDAVGPSGLQVKGTTLTGFDVEKSLSKTLRKPDTAIPSLLGAGRVGLRTFMDQFKTTSSIPTGRINTDTILLRVIK